MPQPHALSGTCDVAVRRFIQWSPENLSWGGFLQDLGVPSFGRVTPSKHSQREKLGHVAHAIFFIHPPVNGVRPAGGDAKRLLRHKADQWIVTLCPLLGENADIEGHACQCAESADAVFPGEKDHWHVTWVYRRVTFLDARHQQVGWALPFRFACEGAIQS
jgi:hypothetical protein